MTTATTCPSKATLRRRARYEDRLTEFYSLLKRAEELAREVLDLPAGEYSMYSRHAVVHADEIGEEPEDEWPDCRLDIEGVQFMLVLAISRLDNNIDQIGHYVPQ